MARKSGSYIVPGTLEIQADAPADARLQVKTLADLTASGSFPYKYIGMIVSVESEQKAYMLIGADPTVSANWQEQGAGTTIEHLSDISDVDLSSPSDGEGLVYDGTNEKWENKGVLLASSKGVSSGVAELDANGKVPASQLPGFVDDVVEGHLADSTHFYAEQIIEGYFYEEAFYEDEEHTVEIIPIAERTIYKDIPTDDLYKWNGTAYVAGTLTPIVGEEGKIFVDFVTNLSYRWSGSAFVSVASDLALGETSSTAYRGDRGKAAYDHSQLTSGNPHNVTKADIGLDNVDNTSDLDKPISTATQTALNAKADTLQFATMPIASSENLGAIVQYIGSDTQDYTNGFYYQCVSDGEIEPTYSWEQKDVQPTEGGSGSLTKAITAAIDVGGISAGSTYSVGTDVEDILSDLLEPTLYPTFTAPSAGLTYSASQYYAVGGTVNALAANVTLNRGTITPAYGTSGYRSGATTGYSIATVGADTEFSDSSENSGSFSVPALTRATKGTIVVTGTVNYAAGEQPKDSKGNNYSDPLAAGSVSASKTLTFIQPYYYGVSNSSTIADFTGLTENVTAKGQKTFNYTTNNQYMVIAYDSSYGNLKTITDSNGFDVTDGWQKNTLTVNGFSYFVYVSKSPTTDTNAPFTFKY